MILFSRIGKENFELRKKLFEHLDESSFAGENILLEYIYVNKKTIPISSSGKDN